MLEFWFHSETSSLTENCNASSAMALRQPVRKLDESKYFLLRLMGAKITVEILDNRKFVGSLMCTDRDGNIAMRDVVEHPPPDVAVKDNLTRRLFLITIRGIHIKKILAEARSVYNVKRVCGVVSLYWAVSISLVFINKWLLSNSDISLDIPLFITWFQCLVTVILCIILSKISSAVPDKLSFPSLDFKWQTALNIMPLSSVFFTMVVFNNLCLKYLDVAFYFVARSLTTIFNVVLTYLILRKKTCCKAIACCGVIIAGYITSVLQENGLGTLSPSGLFYGLSASFSVSLFSILTSKRLPYIGGSVWRLTFYNNLNASVLFIAGIVVTGELTELQYLPHAFSYLGLFFWGMMLISGVFGFAISYVTTWQIQVTSPLTHNISGTAKAAAQTILATIISLHFRSVLWWLGNCMVVAGSVAYAYVRHKLALKEHQHQQGTSTDGDREAPPFETVAIEKDNPSGEH
ncbi:GDP-fucose transporter [Echinococcus granulosus]|uniref:GDP-fucose transporter n=2 Tax=Echinococcus granulosus TaxID=6210 RepID=W6UWI8_ECHGR|nr:GDP-fucose transporter [Echinococcus granulosus]EUB64991.1 GDP-fucose transporter [Echinococcus granulosus]